MTPNIEMTIQTEDFRVWYEAESYIAHLSGVMRLAGPDAYHPIAQLLERAATSANTLTLNVRELKLLNSSGIHMLSKFMIQQRKREGVQICIWGNSKIEWQTKTLETLRRLLPSLVIELD